MCVLAQHLIFNLFNLTDGAVSEHHPKQLSFMDKGTFLSESKKIISRVEAGATTEEIDNLTNLKQIATERQKSLIQSTEGRV
ncbi:hypothetical protein BFS16_00660 [Hoylesella timonensis]|uniref:Uncharacterized protein n=2 Tax=Hoylesella timonensis TaxID=386414 RepID=A0A2K0XPG7_9BACT|nr:hypothetical protein BFS16_00660 [Hoylesella timonensis]